MPIFNLSHPYLLARSVHFSKMVETRSEYRRIVSDRETVLHSSLPYSEHHLVIPYHLSQPQSPFSPGFSSGFPSGFPPASPDYHHTNLPLQLYHQPAQGWSYNGDPSTPHINNLDMSANAQKIVQEVQRFANVTQATLEKYKPLLQDTAALKASIVKLETKINSRDDSNAVRQELLIENGQLTLRIDYLEAKIADLEGDRNSRVDHALWERNDFRRKRSSESNASGAEDSAYGSEEERDKKIRARTIQLDVHTEWDLNEKLNRIAQGQYSMGSALALMVDEVAALRERQDFMEERVDEQLEKLDKRIAAMFVSIAFLKMKTNVFTGITILLLAFRTHSYGITTRY
jgi:hypothetical protein